MQSNDDMADRKVLDSTVAYGLRYLPSPAACSTDGLPYWIGIWWERDIAERVQSKAAANDSEIVRLVPADRIEQLERELAEAKRDAERWIPVSERLPADDRWCAVLYADGGVGIDMCEEGGWTCYENAQEEYRSIACAEMINGTSPIIGWHPLPAIDAAMQEPRDG